MGLVRELRGGRDYDAQWGQRMTGTGPFAELLRGRFELARRRYGLGGERMSALRTELFRDPEAARQIGLFG